MSHHRSEKDLLDKRQWSSHGNDPLPEAVDTKPKDLETIEKGRQGTSPAQPQNDEYLSGIRLLVVTLGLMAVVLMVALDNYVLGLPASLASSINFKFLFLLSTK